MHRKPEILGIARIDGIAGIEWKAAIAGTDGIFEIDEIDRRGTLYAQDIKQHDGLPTGSKVRSLRTCGTSHVSYDSLARLLCKIYPVN